MCLGKEGKRVITDINNYVLKERVVDENEVEVGFILEGQHWEKEVLLLWIICLTHRSKLSKN